MKKSFFFLCLLVMILFLFGGVCAEVSPTPTATATATITPSVNSSISINSDPSGAKVFLKSSYKGYTPLILYNLTPGSYSILVQKGGYQDWSGITTLTAGNHANLIAILIAEAKETTTITTAPTTTATTVKTTVKSTAKPITPWPSATPTPASPVGILVILGAIGAILIIIRKS